MSNRANFDISSYFVVGPENTKGRPPAESIRAVVEAGYSCLQIRSKILSARELIRLTEEAALIIAAAGRSDDVALLVNDRLDVVLAARAQGIRVDGIHVGQSDIPVEVCRQYLGADAIIGLSADTSELLAQLGEDIGSVDYLGAGPLHPTETKPDCGLGPDGRVLTKSFEDIKRLAAQSPLPVVVGGGVKLADIPRLAQTGVGGFFVVSAISESEDPKAAATALLAAWRANCGRQAL